MIATTEGEGALWATEWMEARAAADHPTVPGTSPHSTERSSPISTACRLRNPDFYKGHDQATQVSGVRFSHWLVLEGVKAGYRDKGVSG